MDMSSRKKWVRAGLAAIVVGLVAFFGMVLPTALGAAETGVAATTTNTLVNGDFEAGVAPWTCKNCTLTAGTPAHEGAAAAQLRTTNIRARAQLFQRGITLSPQTEYQLTFWAKSSGQDLQVDVQKQVSPFTSYGLNRSFNVTSEWQQFTVTFTTAQFNAQVSDARLRFRTPKGRGHTFSIDNISLVALGTPPTPTPSPTPPSTGGSELLVFDWNKPVTTAQKGFPWDKPPRAAANGNWKQPINYAEGTLHLRAEIFSIPQPQDDMRIQFCFWQYKSQLENCTRTVEVPGRPGTVVEWSVDVQNLWKKNGAIIEWDVERHRNGIAIKNGNGKPVSNYSGWNWNGENPDHWYPMNARFTVVVVEKGKTFSGWDNYIP